MRIPDGAEFENPKEGDHFSSVLVFHAASKTVHVDDTILFVHKPGFILRCAGKVHGNMEFWDLKKGLRKTESSPLEFKSWVERLLHDWDFDNIVTAHTGNKIGGAKEQLRELLSQSVPTLEKLSREHAACKSCT